MADSDRDGFGTLISVGSTLNVSGGVSDNTTITAEFGGDGGGGRIALSGASVLAGTMKVSGGDHGRSGCKGENGSVLMDAKDGVLSLSGNGLAANAYTQYANLNLSAKSTMELGGANAIATVTVSNSVVATVAGALVMDLDGADSGSADRLIVTNGLNISEATLDLEAISSLDDIFYVLVEYGSLTGTFATISDTPAGYALDYAFDGNRIALVSEGARNNILTVTAETGGSATAGGTFDYGTNADINATPYNGYHFDYWTGSGVADAASANTTVSMTTDRNVSAIFALNKYFLAVNAGVGGSAIGEGNYTHGTNAIITASSAIGHHFVNWSGGGVVDENSSATSIAMDQNRSVMAHFAIDEHTLTVSTGTGGSVSGEGNYTYGIIADINATADTGYDFAGWAGVGVANPNNANSTVAMTQDRNVTATFALKSYTLATNSGFGGSAAGAAIHTHGAQATVTATPITGYSFAHWAGDGIGDVNASPTTVDMTQDRNVTANFVINKYVLTVNTGTGGTVTGSGAYDYNSSVSITANSVPGNHFVAWTGTGTIDSSSPSTTVSMTTDRNVTAGFAINRHLLTVNSTPGGSISGSDTYDYGTAVSITATPESGYHFVNWTGNTVDDGTSASTTLTLTADANVTANFKADIHTLTVAVGTGGTVLGDGNFTYGSHAAIIATSLAGYYFINWNGAGIADANSSFTTVPMTQDRNVTANFALIPANKYVLQTFANPVGSGSTGGGNTYVENSVVTLTATAGAGHQFLGWTATGGTLASPLSNTSATITLDQNADANATANFAPIRHKLDLVASSGGSVSGDGNYSHGEIVPITATPDAGYGFAGWEVNGTMNFSVTAATRQYDASSNTYYVNGKESPPLTLVRGNLYQFMLDGSTTANHPFYFSTDSFGGGNFYAGEFLSGVSNSQATSGIVALTVGAGTLSTLYYYCGNHSGMGNVINVIDSTGLVADTNTASTSVMANGAYALNASFTLDERTLTMNAGAGGGVLGGGTFDYGTDATVTATPAAGYVFSNWSGSGVADANSPTTIVSMTSDRNVTANFELASHVITVTTEPSAAGSAIGGGSFSHGQTTTIATTPATGYSFTGWTGTGIADANASSTTVTATFSQTIIANFASSKHHLSLQSNPNGTGTLAGGGTYDYGTDANVTATPAAGYVFSSWSGSSIADANSPTTIVSMTSDRNVTANFELASHVLTVMTEPSTGGSAIGGGSFSHGQIATIAITPATGYSFTGWTGTGIADADASSTTVNVSSSQTIIANFASSKHHLSLQSNPNGTGTLAGGGTYDYGSDANITATPVTGYVFFQLEWIQSSRRQLLHDHRLHDFRP